MKEMKNHVKKNYSNDNYNLVTQITTFSFIFKFFNAHPKLEATARVDLRTTLVCAHKNSEDGKKVEIAPSNSALLRSSCTPSWFPPPSSRANLAASSACFFILTCSRKASTLVLAFNQKVKNSETH